MFDRKMGYRIRCLSFISLTAINICRIDDKNSLIIDVKESFFNHTKHELTNNTKNSLEISKKKT